MSTTKNLSDLHNDDLDQLHYEILRGWNYTKQAFFYQGIDFFELTQFFLWDKVGRSIRKKLGNYDPKWDKPPLPESELSISRKLMKNRMVANWDINIDHSKKSVFIPLMPSVLDTICKPLLENNNFNIVTSTLEWKTYWKSSYRILTPRENQFISNFYYAILDGIGQYDLQFEADDQIKLLAEIRSLLSVLPKIQSEFNVIQPDVVLLHTDNHPPYQLYCFEAQKRNIPVVMFQHGLDCEHYILENAFADYIAVWGQERKGRYLKNSERKPRIRVTGNPNFGKYKAVKNRSQDNLGENIVWITRPHSTTKCYSPYHYPTEAQEIVRVLLKFLEEFKEERLVIRPHPATDISLYTSSIEESLPPIRQRITIDANQTLLDQLNNAKLVIVEDTTVALEAMLLQKALIHVHFAKNTPVLKIVEYVAGYEGYNRRSLMTGLRSFMDDPTSFKGYLEPGQNAFIKDYLDDSENSASKIIDFIEEIIK